MDITQPGELLALHRPLGRPPAVAIRLPARCRNAVSA